MKYVRVCLGAVWGIVCCCALVLSCATPDSLVPDSSCELSSLKCHVHYDASRPAVYETVDLLSGTYYPEKGLISFNFTSGEKFTAETLKRCRIEATVPSTARVELLDASGKPTGVGLAGWHDLCNQTLWFRVVAANGDSRNWQLTCNLK